jgi:hypothetical protein
MSPQTNHREQGDTSPVVLSKDAITVQLLTADLSRMGYMGEGLPTVQRHGYLRDWTPARWERAAQELAQARLLQRWQQASLAGQTARWTGLPDGSNRNATHARVVYGNRAGNAWGRVHAGLRAHNAPRSRPPLEWSSRHSTPYEGMLTQLASGG